MTPTPLPDDAFLIRASAHLASRRYTQALLTCEGVLTAVSRASVARKDARRPGWAPVLLRQGATAVNRENVEAVTALVLDHDAHPAPVSEEALVGALRCLGAEAVWHGSPSWTPDEPRWRVVIPLSAPIPASAHPAAMAELLARLEGLGVTGFDRAALDPTRRFYAPFISADTGQADLVSLLGLPRGLIEGPRHTPSTPAGGASSAPGAGPIARDTPAVNRKDPTELPGAVGAFNRCYTHADVIERWGLPLEPIGEGWRHVLSTQAVPSLTPVPGSNGSLLFDHSTSSPTHGRTLSAWDLLREWMWGAHPLRSTGMDADLLPIGAEALDSEEDMGFPPAERPSSKRAEGVLTPLSEVQRELAAAAFGSAAPPAPAPPPSPVPPASSDDVEGAGARAIADDFDAAVRACEEALPPRNSKGKRDIRNPEALAILTELDPVLSSLRTSVMGNRLGWASPPPWRDMGLAHDVAEHRTHGVMSLRDGEVIRIAAHLARYSGGRVVRAEALDAIDFAATADRKQADPIRDYLEGLEWDGVPRLDGACPGIAEDDSWGRLAVRTAMIAAVRRVFEPGCQSDSSLVLVGGQGTRKSTWVRWLAGPWSTTLPDVTRSHADVCDACHGAWIVEADEGFTVGSSMSRRAAELKRFLSQRSDTWRPKYGRFSFTAPRRFSVWGTTNDEDLLSVGEGNRRYWPVRVVKRMPAEFFTDEMRDQLWAEAVACFRAGESSWMSTEAAEARAELAQRGATVDDVVSDRVETVLAVARPEGWAWMTTRERELAPMASGGTRPREVSIQAILDELPASARIRPREVASSLRTLGWIKAGRMMRDGRRASIWLPGPTLAAEMDALEETHVTPG